MSNEIMAQVIAHHINLDGSPDRPNAKLFMNRHSLIRLKVAQMTYIGRPRRAPEAFGIPIEQDDAVADGVVELRIVPPKPKAHLGFIRFKSGHPGDLLFECTYPLCRWSEYVELATIWFRLDDINAIGQKHLKEKHS